METDTLNLLIDERLYSGQRALANHLRTLVYKTAPYIFDLLEFDDDLIFLEPALFAWFTCPNPTTPIEQQLFGLLAPELRPSTTPATTDTRGRIYLPKLGTFYTQQMASRGHLTFGDQGWIFATDQRRETVTLKPPLHLQFGQWPCFLQVPQVWHHFFKNPASDAVYDLEDGIKHSAKHIAHLQRALTLIEHQDPPLAQWLSTCVRGIQLYQASQPNSFASLSVHGMAFLNISDEADEVFYLDDLAHQCGHVIFNAATHPPRDYLTCSPDTPLATINGAPQEQRSVYSAFHGLCTYSLIIRTLWKALNGNNLNAKSAHQARGRLSFYLSKFAQDLRALSAPGLFTAQGEAFYQAFKNVFTSADEHLSRELADLDLSNQPYVFNAALFSQCNRCHFWQTGG